MKLYAEKGWGSAIVEAQLAWYDVPFELVPVGDLFHSDEAQALLAPLNPVRQVPTLVLADGSVMTESAAITLWLAERSGSDELVPPPGAPERPQFLRWLLFLVANIYPCFTFADHPPRFIADEAARKPFRAAVDAHEQKLWRAVEAAAKGPWFLGDRLSAIDIYLGVMTRWRPGRAWFETEAPRLHASAIAIERHPRTASIFVRNAPDPA
jgi:GST-like protein